MDKRPTSCSAKCAQEFSSPLVVDFGLRVTPVSVTSRSTQLLTIYAVCVHKFLPLVRAHPLIDRPVTHPHTLNLLAKPRRKGKLNRAHRRVSIEARGRAFDISSFSQASKIPPFSLLQSTSSPSRICLRSDIRRNRRRRDRVGALGNRAVRPRTTSDRFE